MTQEEMVGASPSGLVGSAPQITSIRAERDGAEMVLSVRVCENGQEESRRLVIPTAVYLEKNLRRGAIGEDTLEELQGLSRVFEAIRCGENLLAFGSNTQQMLTRKIMRHGFTRDEAESAAASLLERGLIREDEDLRREVEKCLRKLWGRRRIAAYLRSRGFADETLAALPDLLENVDFAEQCARLIRKQYGRIPADRTERDRMFASLSRYGYSLDEIRHAMETF